ncbi:MAG: outer membrane lipid asymmetry maintenance protein MlaD [Coxiella sp. RIFCSPHIGHO2_12_FULL_44_14]|nr:MAG: outer membrane lipid asymmetry maintenance protein MlaD [Coxiella sp. RIFCSPHIGHO2_12_FULL_44_14]
MKSRVVDFVVGIFIIAALLALLFLAFRVSNLTNFGNGKYYKITAEFDNIGGLKIRAPVSVSGVKIGEVATISLDSNNYRALVSMRINARYNNLPIDTSANIFTQGILGSNYISLSPGFDEANLKAGSRIETTHSALVLENLIGQLIYSLKSDNDGSQKKKNEKGEGS